MPNEFFYEIFDYLDGYHIYNSFSNLNHRFQQLLNSSSLLFKIKFDKSTSEEIIKPIILRNRHKILSIHLLKFYRDNETVSSLNIDSSFIHLQSLVMNSLGPEIIRLLFPQFVCLPRLFSLSIHTWYTFKDLSDIYQLIFQLPKLKYMNFAGYMPQHLDKPVSLPIATSEEFSPIEHLILDHHCTFEQLCNIISCTPQLRRLNIMDTLNGNPNIGIISSTTLSNLVNFSIQVYDLTFDKFEIFIRRINFKLKVLRMTACQDINYLVANRWEKLILQCLPQLEKFYLEYDEYTDDDFEFPTYPGELNQFTSSFWIERQWIFEAEITSEYMKYSIHPYRYTEKRLVYEIDYLLSFRKRWYEFEVSKSARLTLAYIIVDEVDQVISEEIERVLNVEQIYHLEILEEKIFIGTLFQVIDLLPELNTLKIHSLSLNQRRSLCFKDLVILCSTESTSKITKVYLEKMINIKDVYYLMALCPYMTHFKVDFINDMDVKVFLRKIFKKLNHGRNKHLRSLCFRVQATDDEYIKKLEEVINAKKRLLDYTIKRVLESVYLEWK